MLLLFPSLSLEFPFSIFSSPLIPSFYFIPRSYLYVVREIPQFRGVSGEGFGRGWVGGCRGGRKGHLQISSINHPTHSNVTNILQLEETRRSSEPSISLIPHDHRFIRPCLRAEQTHTHTHTRTLLSCMCMCVRLYDEHYDTVCIQTHRELSNGDRWLLSACV